MSKQFTDTFIGKVQAAYYSSEPLFTEILHEQQEFKIYLAMMRAAIEVTNEPGTASMADTLTRMLKHFEKVTTVIGIHRELAALVNAVTREHEE